MGILASNLIQLDARGDAMVGESSVMCELREQLGRVAQTTFTVLVEGESGAGKELVAREIHARSRRRRGPFVAVNCAALVETLLEAELFGIEERTATGVRGRRGKFELADEGTLFLDEVADLSLAAQAKLLRVLQDTTIERVGGHESRRVNVRVIAATNRRLLSLVQVGRFRPDLYYRLAGVEIFVPPLRARRDDIPRLIEHFLGTRAAERALPLQTEVVEALTAYDWPGNVRQLSRILERALALSPGPVVTIDDLPGEITHDYRRLVVETFGRDDTLKAWTARYTRLVLDRYQGNKRQACEELAISYHKLKILLAYEHSLPRLRVDERQAPPTEEARSPTAGEPEASAAGI